LFAFGQKAEDFDNVIKNAPFVFEGKVIKQVYFVDTLNFDKAYTANIVQISKIFRGEKDNEEREPNPLSIEYVNFNLPIYL